MWKYLAMLCFLAVGLLLCSETGLTSSRSGGAVSRDDEVKNSRSTRRVRIDKREITSEQRKAAASAILDAASVTVEPNKGLMWSQENFDRHLAKLSTEEIKNLLDLVLTQKEKGSYVFLPKDETTLFRQPWVSFETNQGKVISGLVDALARHDFMDTVEWLESRSYLTKISVISRSAFSAAILAGASQNPAEAWRIYKSKCAPNAFG